MALRAPSLFLYGFQVTENNSSVDFIGTSGGPELHATLTLGFYSLSGLATEIKRQMQIADPAHTYTITVDRTIAGGTQNRVSIATSGAFLSLLFASGSRTASTVATLIGFAVVDRTGSTSYTGTASAGTVLVTNMAGYNYSPPEANKKNFGALNVSASGVKEAIVFATQSFWQVQFRYIPELTMTTEWTPLMTWMIAQREIEFTREVTNPTVFEVGTIESTAADNLGLSYQLPEMLPKFPFTYETGNLKFRVKAS
jgi:hypothetical protein